MHDLLWAFGGDNVKLNVVDSKVARGHDEDPTAYQCFPFQTMLYLMPLFGKMAARVWRKLTFVGARLQRWYWQQ